MRDEIRKLVESGKTILGTERTMKLLKNNKISKLYLASNFPQDLKQDLERYAKVSSFDIIETTFNNEELGIVCRKPFLVSVVGVVRE